MENDYPAVSCSFNGQSTTYIDDICLRDLGTEAPVVATETPVVTPTPTATPSATPSGSATAPVASESASVAPTTDNGGNGGTTVKRLKFKKAKVKVKVGKTAKLKVNKKAKFSVNNKKVLKLMTKKAAKAAKVKGLKKGKAVVTAKAGGKKAKCKVTVK